MKFKLTLFLIPVILTCFAFYGYEIQDNPNTDLSSTQEFFNSMNSNPPIMPQAIGDSCFGAGQEKHDDGSFENGGGWNNTVTDGRLVMKFRPNSYPWKYTKFCVGVTRLAAGADSMKFDVVIYDSTGVGGSPGALLGTLPNQVIRPILIFSQFSWFPIDISAVAGNIVTSGAVYIGIKYDATQTSQLSKFVMIDESVTTPVWPGYSWANAGPWANATVAWPNYKSWGMRTMGETAAPSGGGSITVTRNQYVQIPDNGGNANPAVDNLDISGIAGNVEIKKVTLTINNVVQSWVGDLRFWLTKDNAVDTSISRIGWIGTGFGNSCDNLTGTILSDSVGLTNIQNIPTVCVGGLAQATGNFNPKEPFTQFQNSGVNPNGTYTLRISDNAAGDTGSIRSWTLKIDYDIITGVNNNVTSIANDFSLNQNYPNPFNPSTKIAYSIPTNGFVSLKIFNILGKEVQTLVSEVKTAGSYEVSFNGASLSSGVYFYRLESGNFIDTKKMFLLK